MERELRAGQKLAASRFLPGWSWKTQGWSIIYHTLTQAHAHACRRSSLVPPSAHNDGSESSPDQGMHLKPK